MELPYTVVQCPYNKTHQMIYLRLAKHLITCRREHKNVKKVHCPFNSTHVVNEPELEFHVGICEYRKNYENYKAKTDPVIGSTVSTPTEPQPIECEENWDDDDTPSYNPQKYVANSNVLRTIPGATKSSRKKFRAEERVRHLALQNGKK